MEDEKLIQIQLNLKNAEKLNSDWLKAENLLMLGNYYYEQEDIKKAIINYESALKLFKKYSNARGMIHCLLRLGELTKEIGNYKDSLKYYEDALDYAEKFGDISNKGYILAGIGLNYLQLVNYENAVEKIKQALIIFDELNNKVGKADCQNYIGECFMHQNNLDETDLWFKNCLDIADQLSDKSIKSKVYTNLAIISQLKKDELNAFTNFGISLEIDSEINDRRAKAIDLNNMALIYKIKNEDIASLNALNEALSLLKESNDKALIESLKENLKEISQKKWSEKNLQKIQFKSHPAKISMQINNFIKKGLDSIALQSKENNFELDLENLNELLKIANPIGDCNECVELLVFRAQIYVKINDYKNALQVANEARKKKSSALYRAKIFRIIGDVYMNVKDLKSAQESYEMVIKIANSLGDPLEEAFGLSKSAAICIQNNNFTKSIKMLEEALSIFEKMNEIQGQRYVYEKLAENYMALGDRQTALKYKLKKDQLAKEIK